MRYHVVYSADPTGAFREFTASGDAAAWEYAERRGDGARIVYLSEVEIRAGGDRHRELTRERGRDPRQEPWLAVSRPGRGRGTGMTPQPQEGARRPELGTAAPGDTDPGYGPEAVTALANGRTIRTDTYDASPGGASYVRVCEADGTEIAYWSCDEWRDDPQLVMGAILGAANGGALSPEVEGTFVRHGPPGDINDPERWPDDAHEWAAGQRPVCANTWAAATAGTWECPGCGSTYPETSPDLVTGHVQACDYVDGAGQEYDVTVKWSVTSWHIATVRSSDLSTAADARPFASLTGVTLDRDEDDPDAALPSFLDELAGGPGSDLAYRDGWEIGAIYDARHDRRQP